MPKRHAVLLSVKFVSRPNPPASLAENPHLLHVRLIVYSHQRFLLCCFDLGCRSKYIVISEPSMRFTLNQCFRRYISGLPLLHGPNSFHLSNTSATTYSLSLQINRLGSPGSPLVIPVVSNVPLTGLIGSLANSSCIFFRFPKGFCKPLTLKSLR
jgi:hypothetical protein